MESVLCSTYILSYMLLNKNGECVSLLGINGFKRAGKDTLAKKICQLASDTGHLSLGYRLKTEVAEIFNYDTRYVLCELSKDMALPSPVCLDLYLDKIRQVTGLANVTEHKKCAFTMRQLLQYYGTEYIRAACATYWFDRIEEVIQQGEARKIVISDIRFDNEKNWIKSNGGNVVRIYRDGVRFNNKESHASEHFDFEADQEFDINSGNQDQFTVAAIECLKVMNNE